jgi:hypothetical protein
MVKDFDFPDSPRSDGHVQELEDGVRDGVVRPDEDSEVVFELAQMSENFFVSSSLRRKEHLKGAPIR